MGITLQPRKIPDILNSGIWQLTPCLIQAILLPAYLAGSEPGEREN